MKESLSKSSVCMRFGILGWWLYKHLKEDSRWLNKWFIFKRYTGFFALFFGIPSILIMFTTSNKWIIIVVLTAVTVCSLSYGYWAESYFHNQKLQ